MTKNIDKSVTKLVDEISDIIKSTKNFATKETPGVIKEFLRWRLIKNTLSTLGLSALQIPLLYMLNSVYLWPIKECTYNDCNIGRYVCLGILMTISVILTFGMAECFLSALKVLVAPKVVLLEYVTDLISSSEGDE